MAETIIAKIQVRRGDLDDLPVLDEGEFGYAVDYRRLFIGNTPLEFVTDGETTRFTISDKSLIPGQMKILVDGVEQAPGINFRLDGTDLVWDTAPPAGVLVTITYNTELSVINNTINPTMEMTQLLNNVINRDTGLNWNIANGNSAILNYSIVNTAGDMHIGILKLITNANILPTPVNPDDIVVGVTDIGGGMGTSGITFDARIENNRVHLTYTNPTVHHANFYYNIQLWNTI
jgi:hypothetical protein